MSSFLQNKLCNYMYTACLTLSKLFGNYNNVIISKNLSPQCASANAKFLIHNGCTTAIEANFAEIKSILPLKIFSDLINELIFLLIFLKIE